MTINPNDLRALADFLDARPELAERTHVSATAFPLDVEHWHTLLATLGSYTKGETGGKYLDARRTFGELVFEVTVNKELTCERVKVGEREVTVEVYPDDVTPETVTTIEDIFEWKCPPSWRSGEVMA